MRWPGEPSLCGLSYSDGGILYRVLFKEMFAVEMRAALPICWNRVCLPALICDPSGILRSSPTAELFPLGFTRL